MIENAEIRNFQSLKALTLDFGRFTVIVGASSSGKTALMRAFRAIASNVRGGGVITRGAKATAISVRTGEHKVTLERTETTGQYRIVGPDGAEETFTKLAGSVPDAVTRALRIQPVPTNGASVNFASQFDRPFLLDDSGATVARTLGELTNVTTILQAVREANRRRATAASTLRTREADLADLFGRLREFADLTTRRDISVRAAQAADNAEKIQSAVDRLRVETSTLAVAEGVLARAQVLPPLPTDASVTTAKNQLDTFKHLLKTWLTAEREAATNQNAATYNANHERELHDEWHAALAEAGICPTCQREISA